MLRLGLGFAQSPHLLGCGFGLEFGDPPLFLEFGFGLGFRSGSGFGLGLGLALALGLKVKVSAKRVHSSLLACRGGVRLEECLGG